MYLPYHTGAVSSNNIAIRLYHYPGLVWGSLARIDIGLQDVERGPSNPLRVHASNVVALEIVVAL